ncbi:hypothetical protein FC89_GL000287 [Liquorilactobacillus ghanensis DSM 18630]|uniref:HTH cro/C1-type domain-containing protein n=1 Tax=Liquorilactobacillus ghanensis DSM 18630 TaxID=1423750 RepID=A0A0R1VN16_9LACO|nr:helix-turn-helix transcriptional regulator [Liquorilactobacillus ghanensis]KRM06978.1 hypothetical protein FC89_GL000287 [Liquorilactobacillus ghanensis DSM 18630]
MENGIGTNVKKIRKAIGMTQDELALKIGITSTALGNYERGERRLPSSLIIPISRILEVDERDILGSQYRRNNKKAKQELTSVLKQLNILEKQVRSIIDTLN